MNRQHVVAAALAVTGFGAIVFGIYQDALHVAQMYDGTIETGWGGSLNHEERLLARLGALGAVGSVAALRWRHLAVVPAVTGAIVLFYPLRAIVQWTSSPELYTEVPTHDGGVTRIVLGAEPFLLIAGGGLLVGAAFLRWRSNSNSDDSSSVTVDESAST
ncbi:hypothetical protein C453_10500 [Haloferax elongans ATCC BAA-1513]|uniref:Uncharacterized protein n=1 Tax=Haloferax elongans ATCC BAA-1513 TaxID=1230453 RepID=M0HPI9_HALEO|nr:hypothetical protein [Haloferax elongans]ELZ85004.1 hypothetical protein C453_10500 [Haloferax elongans ATCC BAA-1513]